MHVLPYLLFFPSPWGEKRAQPKVGWMSPYSEEAPSLKPSPTDVHLLMFTGAFQLTSSLNWSHSEQGDQEGDRQLCDIQRGWALWLLLLLSHLQAFFWLYNSSQHTQIVWREQLGHLRFAEASRPYNNILEQSFQLSSKVNGFALHLLTSGKGCYCCRVLFC